MKLHWKEYVEFGFKRFWNGDFDVSKEHFLIKNEWQVDEKKTIHS